MDTVSPNQLMPDTTFLSMGRFNILKSLLLPRDELIGIC